MISTVFENHRKSLIFENLNEGWSQTVLTDRSLLIGQKLVENAKSWKIEMGHFK